MIPVLVSTGSFDALLEACDRLAQRYEFVGQIGKSRHEPRFPFCRLAPPDVLERRVSEAELVVTHGGTGMLSLLYRNRKPGVIVPRQVRYGHPSDEQVPLARKWAELGMGVLCLDVTELGPAIEECRRRSFSFPTFPPLGGAVRALILERSRRRGA